MAEAVLEMESSLTASRLLFLWRHTGRLRTVGRLASEHRIRNLKNANNREHGHGAGYKPSRTLEYP